MATKNLLFVGNAKFFGILPYIKNFFLAASFRNSVFKKQFSYSYYLIIKTQAFGHKNKYQRIHGQ